MKHASFSHGASDSRKSGFGLVWKATTAMAVIALALVGALAPEIVDNGLTWGQGLVALSGAALGAFLALHR